MAFVVDRSGVDAVAGCSSRLSHSAVAHGRKPAYRGPMIVERRKGERSVGLVYLLDRTRSQRSRMSRSEAFAYLIRYADPGCGRGSGS